MDVVVAQMASLVEVIDATLDVASIDEYPIQRIVFKELARHLVGGLGHVKCGCVHRRANHGRGVEIGNQQT